MLGRFKGVLQHDTQDCGAACLTSILNYFGNNASLSLIKEELKVDKSGSNLYTLSLIAERHGLASEALNGTFDELLDEIKIKNISLPFIAHFQNDRFLGHFVVVYKICHSKMLIFDPSEGNKRLSFEEFLQKWTGSILTFEKTKSCKKTKQVNITYGMLRKIMVKDRKNFSYVIVYSLCISLISMLGAFFYKNVVDSVISSEKTVTTVGGIIDQLISNINLLFLVLILLYIFQLILNILNGFTLAKISERINNNLMMLFFNHVIGLPLEFIDRTDSGSILSRYNNIIEIQNQGINALLSIILDTIMAIVGAIILLLISPLLFILVFIVLMLYSILTIVFISPLKNANRDIQKEHSDSVTTLNEVLDGIGTIKIYQGEWRFVQKFSYTIHQLSKGIFKSLNLKNILDSLVIFVESVGTIAIILLGGKLVVSDSISLGALIAFESLASFFTIPVKNIIKTIGEFQNVLISISRLEDVFAVEEEYSLNKSDILTDKKIKRITLSSVEYSYNLIANSLNDINLVIDFGTITGILGGNGSGKSTLLKMVATLIYPTRGKIFFNEMELTKDVLSDIRQKLSYVSQSPYVFEGTLRENLTLGSLKISEKQMIDLCQKFDLFNLVVGGNDLDLFLLENGENLSGGQKQKIGIVRALLSNPDVLLLDEATSGLDKESERKVFEHLKIIKNDMIIITIFHDLDFVKYIDQAVMIDKGKVVYDGSVENIKAVKD
ncbi:peptidase domain-containing ABC transporter [Streptococcus saliviloxodontae]|uniref:ATP-binding cassette subfamily B protein n=1 Tax=Streptococcus saliviloxodontae TaxID=1349416 RepID=A0ABS2PL75_9STRE|nr:peptidase domain-containing ABC transporter [Streptococcus saliviloxodontae]MBM7636027.1 ATP-binding cassette subfamily B protein [Streptococcus saliviloxodontae]